MSGVEYIVLHHTAGAATDTAEDIRRYHVDQRGWRDIGYHWVVRPGEGSRAVVEQGRPHDFDEEWEPWEYGAHAHRHHNSRSIAVVMVGRFDGDRPEPPVPMLWAAAVKVADLCNLFGLSADNVFGHRELANVATVCPGVSDEWLDEFRAMVRFLTEGKKGKA